jgi:hypothetical protein
MFDADRIEQDSLLRSSRGSLKQRMKSYPFTKLDEVGFLNLHCTAQNGRSEDDAPYFDLIVADRGGDLMIDNLSVLL